MTYKAEKGREVKPGKKGAPLRITPAGVDLGPTREETEKKNLPGTKKALKEQKQ